MRCSHPCLDRRVRVLDSRAPDSHGIWRLFKTHLHFIDHGLMFPAGYPPVSARRAFVLESTAFAVRAPVPMVGYAFLDVGEAPDQGFACRAAVFVLLRVVNEVGLVESTVGLGPEVFVGGTRAEIPAS